MRRQLMIEKKKTPNLLGDKIYYLLKTKISNLSLTIPINCQSNFDAKKTR